MFARLVPAQAIPGKLNQIIETWNQKDIPLMRSSKGYRGAYLLSDSKTGKFISITLWDTEEDAVADGKDLVHRKILGLYNNVLTGGYISQQYYEISARDNL
jgi:heme-degrading monooxygenase HmoA